MLFCFTTKPITIDEPSRWRRCHNSNKRDIMQKMTITRKPAASWRSCLRVEAFEIPMTSLKTSGDVSPKETVMPHRRRSGSFISRQLVNSWRTLHVYMVIDVVRLNYAAERIVDNGDKAFCHATSSPSLFFLSVIRYWNDNHTYKRLVHDSCWIPSAATQAQKSGKVETTCILNKAWNLKILKLDSRLPTKLLHLRQNLQKTKWTAFENMLMILWSSIDKAL